MSFQAMTWAVEQQLPAMQKIVLLMLANRASLETNECYPSISRLVNECGMSYRSVLNQLAEIENAGLITVIRSSIDGIKQCNTYRLNTEKKYSARDALQKEVVQEMQEGSAGDAHKPINEPVKLTSQLNNKAKTTKQLLFDYGIIDQLAIDFIAHRKTKKAIITKTALEGFQREADKAKISLSDAITYSIERGWIGFKAEWYQNPTHNQQGNNNGQSQPTGKYRPSREDILSMDF